ncbi:MAG: hypothetical protein JWP26_3265 [Devosia sp.]|uniref:DUF2147 domain-containing protein n=1 Tax=Devosia sp. TaxID=1871048 RepID=UPI0026340233|nr:DUF2147 domain-containing protein [Devosia sp.]MDB5588295.1 hypothetical protein [Devosia sp.]
MTFLKAAAALLLALGLVAPVAAQVLSPVGTWQTTTGESRYKVSLCGDGTQLCAKLTWLRADARTPENLALLNKPVVQNAKSIDENKWRGMVKYDGHEVLGSVTLVNANEMKLSGCQLVACKQVDFVRL